MASLDLDSLKRSTDLVEYARARGYQERPREAQPGITVLEHPTRGDRIAVARLPSGGIYAQVNDYAPRGPSESVDHARARLRECIVRSPDTGSIVELVQRRERASGRPEPSLEQVREHLRLWNDLRQRFGQELLERRTPGHVRERVAPALEAERSAGGDGDAERRERGRPAQVANDAKIAQARALDVRTQPLATAVGSPQPFALRDPGKAAAERRYVREFPIPPLARRSGPERGR